MNFERYVFHSPNIHEIQSGLHDMDLVIDHRQRSYPVMADIRAVDLTFTFIFKVAIVAAIPKAWTTLHFTASGSVFVLFLTSLLVACGTWHFQVLVMLLALLDESFFLVVVAIFVTIFFRLRLSAFVATVCGVKILNSPQFHCINSNKQNYI